ncbi:MAG: PAS domain S-box protein, partial [Myxococcota bacterium]
MEEREQLRQLARDFERMYARERRLRFETESIAAGLRVLAAADDPRAALAALLNAIRDALGAGAAFVLEPLGSDVMVATAATESLLIDSRWPAQFLRRRIRKKPAALLDVGGLEEWQGQSEAIRAAARSAIYVPIRSPTRDAVLVYIHPQRGHFGQEHVEVGTRLATLAALAMRDAELLPVLDRQEQLLGLTQEMLGVLDPLGCFEQVNEAWTRVLSHPAETLRGASMIDLLIHPDHRATASGALADVREGREASREFEARCRDRDDHYRWLRWTLRPDRGARQILCGASDITEERRLENLRRRLLNKMERELVGAQTMQGLLLHKRELRGPCSVDVIYQQATYGGGDWFYVDQVGRWLLVVIADVLGHGASAGMLASFGRGYMNGLVSAVRIAAGSALTPQPVQVLSQLNQT